MMDDHKFRGDVVVVPLGVDTDRVFESIPAMQRCAARKDVTPHGEAYKTRRDCR